MSEVLAALFGAIAGGIIQFFVNLRIQKKENDAILISIASEVGSLCQMIRAHRYLEAHEELCRQIDCGDWDGKVWVIDIRSHYFSVFESLAPNLGRLKPHHASSIVRFYTMCKSAIDSVRPDGPAATSEDQDHKAVSVRGLVILLHKILQLGDEITQFPPVSLQFEALQ